MAHNSFQRVGLVLAAVLAVGTGTVGGVHTAAARSGETVTLTLPAPTGPYSVGVTDVHLVDPGRADPWHPDRRRELMVRIWYPATRSPAAPTAAWMPPGGREAQETYLEELGVPPGSWTLARSHSQRDAPTLVDIGRFPILLNSPGMTDTTGWSTAQAEDLAGHGYVVVALEHTHEAFSVHFPDGRRATTEVPLDSPQDVLRDLLLPTRVADTRFVLDRLADLAHERDPLGILPADLAARLDLSKVGMFGHSLGGSTTAQAIHDEPRIRAGVNLDGPVLGSVATAGLDRPLLMLASGSYPWAGDPGWQPGWPNNIGLKIPLRMEGTEHMSFCDQQTIVRQLAAAGLIPADTATRIVGSIDPDRSIELQRDHLRVFFDAVFGRIGTDIVEAITGAAQPESLPHP